MRIAGCLFTLLLCFASPVAAENGEWAFVWVASGPNSYNVAAGRGKVTISGGKFAAELVDENKVSYRIIGSISGERVKVNLSVVGSDYFVNSPFSGSFTRKRWPNTANSVGRESITLTDGWNFIGLTRDLRP